MSLDKTDRTFCFLRQGFYVGFERKPIFDVMKLWSYHAKSLILNYQKVRYSNIFNYARQIDY